ncbi:MAG: Sugar-specific transcriptional regulator TrmB [Thermoplasmata archaeon]|nr:Sugar-specific transcriptional regulator TrmB [Thermoplasmata archaeon]
MLFLALRDGPAMRARIQAQVAACPGISINELSARLGVYWNTVHHHVCVLQRKGLLHVEDRGWRHELYATATPPAHRPWLRALHDRDALQVLAALLEEPGLGVYQLSDELGLSRKVIRAQLARLLEDGLVDKVGHSRPRYRPREPPDEVGLLPRDALWDPSEGLGR